MPDITAIVLTKNEEKNLPDCLRSLEGFASRVLVVDSGSTDATVATPLAKAATTPDVVVVTGDAEQMMWLTMSASYYTGKRFNYRVSGYNSLCVEATLFPYTDGEMNISLGCYGCRAASDLPGDQMFMGIPRSMMPTVISGLRHLAKKAIPESRAKVYLPPV